MRILVLNGPNLNLLGIREPDLYGRKDYASLEDFIRAQCAANHVECEVYQTNHEGMLIDMIHAALGNADAIMINAGGYTHTSIAIMDALKGVALPAVEIHLTDINTREEFRRISYVGKACEKTFAGYGFDSYRLGIEYLAKTYGEKA